MTDYNDATGCAALAILFLVPLAGAALGTLIAALVAR